MGNCCLIYLAVAIAAASQSGANAAHIPSSDEFYYLPGSNKTAIVIQATSSEPGGLFSYQPDPVYPDVIYIRRVTTPWPLVLGKAVFSLTLFFWNLRESGESKLPEWLVFSAKYLLNFVPSAGGVFFMCYYLAHGGKVCSYGVIVTLLDLTVLVYPSEGHGRTADGRAVPLLKQRYVPFGLAAAVIVLLGMILFVVTGLVSLIHGGLASSSSIAVAVSEGCSTWNGTAPYCAVVGPTSFTILTSGDRSRIGFWIAGCLMCAKIILPFIIRLVRCPAEFRRARRTSPQASSSRQPRTYRIPLTLQAMPRYKWLVFFLALLSVLLALLDLVDAQRDAFLNYYNCFAVLPAAGPGNVTLCNQDLVDVSGDTYGFLDIWARYEAGIVESILAW